MKDSMHSGIGVVQVTADARGGPRLPTPAARIVDRLLKAHDRAAVTLPDELLTPDSRGTFCRELSAGGGCASQTPVTTWALDRRYRPGRPYRLKDGRIRVAWSRDGRLYYLTLLTLRGGKLLELRTLPAEFAVKAAP